LRPTTSVSPAPPGDPALDPKKKQDPAKTHRTLASGDE